MSRSRSLLISFDQIIFSSSWSFRECELTTSSLFLNRKLVQYSSLPIGRADHDYHVRNHLSFVQFTFWLGLKIIMIQHHQESWWLSKCSRLDLMIMSDVWMHSSVSQEQTIMPDDRVKKDKELDGFPHQRQPNASWSVPLLSDELKGAKKKRSRREEDLKSDEFQQQQEENSDSRADCIMQGEERKEFLMSSETTTKDDDHHG